MKQLVHQVLEVTFTLSDVNRALILARGEVNTSGWTDAELANPRREDGVLHLDFVATPPGGIVLEVITPIEAKLAQFLTGEAQAVTVHAASNEQHTSLPPLGDQP